MKFMYITPTTVIPYTRTCKYELATSGWFVRTCTLLATVHANYMTHSYPDLSFDLKIIVKFSSIHVVVI